MSVLSVFKITKSHKFYIKSDENVVVTIKNGVLKNIRNLNLKLTVCHYWNARYERDGKHI